jgi:MFS family permease
MTPLLVFITIGSIVNSRLLPRLQQAQRLIAWGQLGTMLTCLLLTQVDAHTSDAWLMTVFGLCGFSLGFQLPNLSLQIMAVAGRRHMGVASALAQTTRMIGSMLGVGVASVLVNALYARQTAAALAQHHITEETLVKLLSSPQILIRQQDQEALRTLAQGLGLDTAPLFEAARLGLVSGTHAAFFLCALIAGVSVVISWKLPHYSLRRSTIEA